MDDFPELVRINIECWKHNYKGIIPQEYLDQLTVEEKLPKWESYFLQEKENTVYYIKLID
ncbi:hypothetical protein KA013_04560 [Patescibacteria group bacterium]|nr:hypothetical protein [Patescibacteria group bacterium]